MSDISVYYNLMVRTVSELTKTVEWSGDRSLAVDYTLL